MQITMLRTNKTYYIVEGGQLSMSYNEDLSSGTILLREDAVIDIEPFDEVKVGNYYFCIDTFNEREVRNRNGNKTYEYEITLMSQTKLLENKILPSLSITPLKSGTKRSIKYYLQLYLDLYGQKIRTYNKFENKFIYDIGNKFDDVCPELQFNNPTLRECITKLMMVKNCIPIVKNNVISYIDLSQPNDKNWDWDNIPEALYKTRSQSSADYVSELRMSMKNVIQDNNLTIATEYIGFRNNDTILLNDKNLELYTQYPIYDLVSLEIVNATHDDIGEHPINLFIRQDLTNIDGKSWIYEKNKYNTLDIVTTMKGDNWANFYKYQNSCLYWTRGSNKIEGFNTTSKKDWFGFETNTFKLIIAGLLNRYAGTTFYETGEYIYTAFKIKYKTKASLLAKFGKDKIQKTEREVVDNQSENYVNAFTQGLLEYAKANRLGNVMKTYSLRYDAGATTLPAIGDRIENDYIIYKTEYGLFNRCIDVTLLACKDYVLRNYFTGVQSKLRSWKIVDSNEAFEREEIYKTYIEFDYEKHEEVFYFNERPYDYSDFVKLVKNLLGNFIDEAYAEDLKHITIGPELATGESYFHYFADVTKNESGHSVIFSCGYEDNESVGRCIESSATGGYKQRVYSYTDGNGECKTFHFIFLYNYNPLPDLPNETKYPLDSGEITSYKNQIYNYQKEQPKFLDIFSHNQSYSFELHKDNKEIMRFNFQYEFCSNQDDIIITDEFMEMVNRKIAHNDLKALSSSVKPNRFNLVLPSGSNIGLPDLTMELDYKTYFYLENNLMSDNNYIYIYNSKNNKILLVYKGKRVYGNFLKDRRKEYYERVGNNWNKIGNI